MLHLASDNCIWFREWNKIHIILVYVFKIYEVFWQICIDYKVLTYLDIETIYRFLFEYLCVSLGGSEYCPLHVYNEDSFTL